MNKILYRLYILTIFIGLFANLGMAGEDLFSDLMNKSDIIAAVEILSTDYHATVVDGPIYGDVKIQKVFKGTINGNYLRFRDGPMRMTRYNVGEKRILFLKKESQDKYYNVYSRNMLGNDIFYEEDFIKDISFPKLESYLLKIQDLQDNSLTLKILDNYSNSTQIYFQLINQNQETIWIDLSKIYCFGHIYYYEYMKIVFPNRKELGWVRLEKGQDITGIVYLPKVKPKETDTIDIDIYHQNIIYPKLCWFGILKSPTMKIK